MPPRQQLLAGIACVLAACARRPTVPVDAPTAPRLVAGPGLNVLVIWNAPVDLDLYLTDPTSEAVYFANNPSHTGARIVHDMQCGDIASTAAPFVEAANMPEPLPGRYRVGVDFIDSCGAKDNAVRFRVVVDFGGARRESTGMVRLDRFEPVALEFDLRRASGNGPLRLDQTGLDPSGLAPSGSLEEN